MYYCKFVYKGYVKQSFYRDGESIQDVLEGLEMFDFGKGKWVVTEAEEI